ncbi:hypothetical protein [Streptomyces sp. NPDC050264]|uniref:hypothetical protein n=1 Tax=Streptomyces sp. NPDC050264 TaxID=3155038 RepID=UPI003413BA14
MTGLALLLFALSALLIAMACVRADWVRSIRRRTYPSGGELPTSAFVTARVLFLAMSLWGVWQGAQALALDSNSRWSHDELTSAVQQTTDNLDGYWYRVDTLIHDNAYFDDYATLIEDRVIRYGGGGAPESSVGASPVSGDADTAGDFTVQANGTEKAFCLHVENSRDKKLDHTPPGIAGGESSGSYRELGYRLAVTARGGAC